MAELTASQIERLGERLRKGVTPEDLALLRQLRESYRPALDAVVEEVRSALNETGLSRDVGTRPAKTTRSIIAKLHRERTNLARMQDIAGCRVIVPRLADQDTLVAALVSRHPDWKVHDLRDRPRHGYRAVHLVTPRPRPVEIQVRTILQQVWAGVSERWDRQYEGIKYGRGPEGLVRLLESGSRRLSAWEAEGGPQDDLLLDRDALVDMVLAMLFPQ